MVQLTRVSQWASSLVFINRIRKSVQHYSDPYPCARLCHIRNWACSGVTGNRVPELMPRATKLASSIECERRTSPSFEKLIMPASNAASRFAESKMPLNGSSRSRLSQAAQCFM